MKTERRFILACGIVIAGSACAELTQVSVGGKVEVYAAWYSEVFERSGASVRIPAFLLPGRDIGPFGTISAVRLGKGGNNTDFFEQRTRLHVNAEFTDDVSAFVEFDALDLWGDGFRSAYPTGADFLSGGATDIALYQSYISLGNVMNWPLALRIGRQELEFGSGWLVGADPGPDPNVGLSFDAIRATWIQEDLGLTLDAWAAKVVETGTLEEDGDTDFYGLYATYVPLESSQLLSTRPEQLAFMPMKFLQSALRLAPFNRGRKDTDEVLQIDAYWMFLRDAASLNDTNRGAFAEWLEDTFGVDDYNSTGLHVVGTRGAGSMGPFDWEAEAAYQFGESDAIGSLFIPNGGVFGDDDSEFEHWGGHAEFGYAPTEGPLHLTRFFVGGSYYGADDDRGLSFREWLNPFRSADASIAFNRLFSSWREDSFLDGSDMSNFWKAYVGTTFQVSESVEVGASWTYYQLVEPFERPKAVDLLGFSVPVAPSFSFWTDSGSREFGSQIFVSAAYAYSEDLSFEIGWSHFFTGEAIDDGGFALNNGLTYIGGVDDDDADYVYFYSSLAF
jgi:hypothetical protein